MVTGSWRLLCVIGLLLLVANHRVAAVTITEACARLNLNRTFPHYTPSASCTPGTLTAGGNSDALRTLNYYRFLMNLPPVTIATFRDDAAQQAARLLWENWPTIKHSNSSSDWPNCFSQLPRGGFGTLVSNLESTVGVRLNDTIPNAGTDLVQSVMNWVLDMTDSKVSHRLWMLHPKLPYVTFGAYAGCATVWVQPESTEPTSWVFNGNAADFYSAYSTAPVFIPFQNVPKEAWNFNAKWSAIVPVFLPPSSTWTVTITWDGGSITRTEASVGSQSDITSSISSSGTQWFGFQQISWTMGAVQLDTFYKVELTLSAEHVATGISPFSYFVNLIGACQNSAIFPVIPITPNDTLTPNITTTPVVSTTPIESTTTNINTDSSTTNSNDVTTSTATSTPTGTTATGTTPATTSPVTTQPRITGPVALVIFLRCNETTQKHKDLWATAVERNSSDLEILEEARCEKKNKTKKVVLFIRNDSPKNDAAYLLFGKLNNTASSVDPNVSLVDIVPKPKSGKSSGMLPLWVIIVIAVVGFVLLVAIALLIVFLVRRRLLGSRNDYSGRRPLADDYTSFIDMGDLYNPAYHKPLSPNYSVF